MAQKHLNAGAQEKTDFFMISICFFLFCFYELKGCSLFAAPPFSPKSPILCEKTHLESLAEPVMTV